MINDDDDLFRIPYLNRMSRLNKSKMLVACLWLRDHKLYTDKLVLSEQEFYRCLTKNVDDNWILVPLFIKMSRHNKQVRNPILLYHAENFRKTLIVKNHEIYSLLLKMFGNYVNGFRVVINDKVKWMIQFTDTPACYIHWWQ